MKITDLRKSEGIFISDIPTGTIFESDDGIYMKTDGMQNKAFEAVNMRTGVTVLLLDTYLVRPLNVELTIHEEATKWQTTINH